MPQDFSTPGEPLTVIVPFGGYIIWGSVLESSQGATMETTSAFVNDTWRINDKFTLSAGLRYDKNEGIDAAGLTTTDDSRVSPRASASYDVFGDGKLVVKAGASRYAMSITQNAFDAGSGPVPSGLLEHAEYKDPAWNAPDGYLAIDQRHKARAWVIWDAISSTRHNLSVSLLQSYWSGTPYSAIGSVDAVPYVGDPADLGYAGGPGLSTYHFSDRGAYRWDDVTRTDIALNYSFFLNLGGTQLELFLQPAAPSGLDAQAGESTGGSRSVRTYNEGVEAQRLGDLELAAAKYRGAAELDPGHVAAYLALAQVSLTQGAPTEALAMADRALELERGNVRATKLAFDAARLAGDTGTAAGALDRLVELDPEWIGTTLYEHAAGLFNANQPEAAAFELAYVVRAHPELARARFMYGVALYNSGRLDEGREQLQALLELAPDDPDAEIARGLLEYGG